MIRYYQRGTDNVLKVNKLSEIDDFSTLIWIDLQNSLLEEVDEVEQFFKVDIPSRLQQEEIESSSRYNETDDYIIANSKFLQTVDESNYSNVHISFIFKGELLLTYREGSVKSFAECIKKLKATINHLLMVGLFFLCFSRLVLTLMQI